MSLPWIQLHASVISHRKSIQLAALIDDPDAWRYLVKLWLWASQNEPTGLIKGAAARMVIEHVCGWRGEPDKLADAMIAAGWIEATDEGLVIHDWSDHQGAHIEKSKRDVERIRAKRRASVAQTSREQPANVAQTSREQPANVAQTSRDIPATFAVRGEERRGEEKREESTSTASPPSSKIPVPTLPPKPPDDPLADGASFFAAVQLERADAGLPREKPPNPRALSAWWSEALMELNGDAQLLVEAFKAYGKDDFWKAKTPPLPFPGFMSQWRKYVPVRPAA